MSDKCLLWDFDNTLAKRDGMWTKSLCNVLINNGYKDFKVQLISDSFSTGFPWHRYEEAHTDYFNNMNWWDYINTLISKALYAIGVDNQNENNKLVNQFKEEYLRIDAWSLFDDTIHCLKHSVNMGYNNIILSNHTPELEMLVEGLGIKEYFKFIITSANVGYDKPNMKIFEEVFKYGTYDEYYMIGDSYSADIIGANNIGFNAILVRKENSMNYKNYSKDLNGIWKFID